MQKRFRNLRDLVGDIQSRKLPVDQMVYLAFISPIMTIPQLYTIWTSKAMGVSFITWVAYLCVATLWLVYGIKYKIKPIVRVQSAWIIVDSAVVLGLLIHR